MDAPSHLYVGIDFSKQDVHFAVHRADGLPLERHRQYANSQVGYPQAKALLLKLLKDQAAHSVDIGGEATSYYWLPLYLRMIQDPDLAAYDLHLYLLNARWVKWFKKSKSPNHKDDQIDPGDIAEYVRFQRPKSTWQYEERWLTLRFYTRLRRHLVKSLTREKNLCDLYLFLAYSTYTRNCPFSHPLGATGLRLLSNPPQVAQVGQLALAPLAQYLDDLSGHHLADPLDSAKRLQQVLTESFPLPPALIDPVHRGLQLLVSNIQELQGRIGQVEGWIADLTRTGYPEVGWLDSSPGVGPVIASGVAAEIGGLERFASVPVWDAHRQRYRPRRSGELVDAVGKEAGLWWPKNASGQFEAEERRLSREGNAYLRYYLLEAADCMRREIPSFAAYYAKKYAAANKHKHKRALVLTGCKALELFVTLLRRQEPYRAKEGDH